MSEDVRYDIAVIGGGGGAGLAAAVSAREHDADAQVLRASDNRPIPGLYAAGEVVGNVVGPQIFSGGAMIAGAIIFGRRAGAVIAGRVLDRAL